MSSLSTRGPETPATPIAMIRSLLQPAMRARELQPWLMMAISDDGMWNGTLFLHREERRLLVSQLEKARNLVMNGPAEAQLIADIALFEKAQGERATGAQVTMIVGAALDAFPTAKLASLRSYTEALTLRVDLDEDEVPITPHALAMAVYWLWDTNTFTPTIAEVLTAARQARGEMVSAHVRAKHLLEMRQSAAKIIDEEEEIEF